MLTEAGGMGGIVWGESSAEHYGVPGTVRDPGCQRPVQNRTVALGEHRV